MWEFFFPRLAWKRGDRGIWDVMSAVVVVKRVSWVLYHLDLPRLGNALVKANFCVVSLNFGNMGLLTGRTRLVFTRLMRSLEW